MDSNAVAQNITTQALVWSTKPLTWEQFKREDGYSYYAGHAATLRWMLQLEGYDIPLDTSTHEVRAEVSAMMIPELSWVRPSARGNVAVLAHEQLHYDIVEWFARQMRKELLSQTYTNKKYLRAVNDIRNKVLSQHRKMQRLYDSETSHGTDAAAQARWKERVAGELAALEGYKDRFVILKICSCK